MDWRSRMLPNIISVHYDDRAVSVAFKFLNSEPWLERGRGRERGREKFRFRFRFIVQVY